VDPADCGAQIMTKSELARKCGTCGHLTSVHEEAAIKNS